MKRWDEADTARAQEELADEAVRVAGTVTAAAKLLGISRRHLTRFRRETRRLTETRCLTETRRTTGLAETPSPARECRGRETPTAEDSLTYGRHAPTFGGDMSTAVATMERSEVGAVVRVNLDLPKPCADWLERKALSRKQARGASRMAKSPIVAELIEEAMRREGAPAVEDNGSRPEKSSPRKRKNGEDGR